LKHPSRDQYISTSSNIEVCKGDATTSNKYVYTLDACKIDDINDYMAEYASMGRMYGHSNKLEFSVWQLILWEAVIKAERKDLHGVWRAIKLAKRAIEFPNEDVFAVLLDAFDHDCTLSYVLM
jgi:hypothetical protein